MLAKNMVKGRTYRFHDVEIGESRTVAVDLVEIDGPDVMVRGTYSDASAPTFMFGWGGFDPSETVEDITR